LTCFALGLLLSLGSWFRFADLLTGNPLPFVIGFTLGNIIALCGSCFLYSCSSQLKSMFAKTRVGASVLYLSSIGATLAFFASRFLFRDAVKGRFGDKLKAIDAGIAREGAFYLFTLRLVPAFPFFVINLAMGLTAIKARTFYWVSQLGMLAGTIVYVNAGTQLAKIDSLRGILSPALLLSFVALGVLPLVAKKVVDAIKVRHVYANWKKPAPSPINGKGNCGVLSVSAASGSKKDDAPLSAFRLGAPVGRRRRGARPRAARSHARRGRDRPPPLGEAPALRSIDPRVPEPSCRAP
jgi:membrane protein DedA with SNARE-associated domain